MTETKPFSLYVHIPFCLQKCPYCDFNTYALSAIPERDYLAALCAELDYWATKREWRGRPIQTIYFGGGTPSLFTASGIRRFISEAAALFPMAERVEVSIEANPGTVDTDKLAGYEDCGVNRISFGAQSLQPETLKSLGRLHTREQILSAVEMARGAGILNINLDLMYGAPQQSLESLRDDLQGYRELKPAHISAYGLTIEKGTPFFTSYRKGILQLPPEETLVEMMEVVRNTLCGAGYTHYEISNFALPSKEARHNLAYWNSDDYLGVGAGAHSCVSEVQGTRKISAQRWSNLALPQRYMQTATSQGHAEGWKDSLTQTDLMFEFFFLGLRKIQGVRAEEFAAAFGIPMEQAYGPSIEVLRSEGLLEQQGQILRLSRRGVLLADSVIENFSSPELPPMAAHS